MTSHHRFRNGVVYSLAALLALALLAAAGAATAGHVRVATAVSGSWAATGGDIVEQRQLGSATYLRQLGSSSFQGDLVGATTFDLRLVLRADFSSFGWATEAFQGKLGGRSGTLSMLERVTGGVDGSVRIDAVVLDGTGELRNVRGTITFVSPLCIPETCEGTYSGLLVG